MTDEEHSIQSADYMLTYLKYLLQLFLAPAHGWEDIEKENPEPRVLLTKGLIPLLIVAALSEAMAFVWIKHTDTETVILDALFVFGAYFVSIFIARLLIEGFMPRLCGVRPDKDRTEILITCALGMTVIFRIINNSLPGNVVMLQFFPLYTFLVLFKAADYMEVPHKMEFYFMSLSGVATVILPMAIYYVLKLIL